MINLNQEMKKINLYQELIHKYKNNNKNYNRLQIIKLNFNNLINKLINNLINNIINKLINKIYQMKNNNKLYL